MVQLHNDERLDDLLASGLKIIQSPSVFAFSLDAVLLAHFTYIKIQKGITIDLCSGNGVIPLLLSKRTHGEIIGVEIQERLHNMAERSIVYNELSEQIQMVHGDLRKIISQIGLNKADVVTCNPPYFETITEEERNKNEHFAIARHEIYCTLEDVLFVGSQLLKQGGKFSLVHRPSRLLDIVTLMRKYRLEPKRLRFVYPKANKEANIILIEGIKDGRTALKVLPPLVVYNEEDEYTNEMSDILYGE